MTTERYPEVIRSQFSERLNQLCDEAQIPPKYHGRQVEVGRIFGVSQRAARRWLEGETLPQFWRITSIAQKFRVSTEWLLHGRGAKHLEIPPSHDKTMTVRAGLPLGQTIPIILWSDIGRALMEKDKNALATGSILSPISFKPELFALIMEGESMLPLYHHGDTIIVDPTREPIHGNDIIYSEEPERFILRRLIVETDGSRYLVALNEDQPERRRPWAAEGKCHGVVVFSGGNRV